MPFEPTVDLSQLVGNPLNTLIILLVLISASFRSKSGGMVLAVIMGPGALSLLYLATGSAVQALLRQPSFSIISCMPDQVLTESQPEPPGPCWSPR